MKNVLKVLTALAAIAGVVYMIATYGDKIVAWAKKLMATCPCHSADVEVEAEATEAAAAPAEEAVEEVVEEVVAEEAPAAEAAPEAGEPVADEADFAE